MHLILSNPIGQFTTTVVQVKVNGSSMVDMHHRKQYGGHAQPVGDNSSFKIRVPSDAVVIQRLFWLSTVV